MSSLTARMPVELTSDIADHLDVLMRLDSATGGIVRGIANPLIVPTTEVTNNSRWATVRTGIYLPCTATRTVRYVGSVHRAGPAIAARLREHFAKLREREATWTHLALITLPTTITLAALRRCEGRAGRALDPLDNTRLPAVPGRPAWIPRPRTA
ncbi:MULTISPECIES: hypothetical protein [unclassified Streptomyces]|uniref:hypothetical protein n=1 Tax=unclassified Streptomyces TaxID=2593676 RepID=UPI000F5C0E58|nr:hypothetical protein [Streptomyces sp. ADI95-17]RPK58909.1 hypothetical protein EES42_36720 [Streptomyces sp. ADI95-17]WSG55579.1 hypothetical protein OHA38_40775 [Streptomyces sp. NBC_01732]WSX06717.1 hypothetical protein OG355_43650 [Streptomyces sp. NBC_00987]